MRRSRFAFPVLSAAVAAAIGLFLVWTLLGLPSCTGLDDLGELGAAWLAAAACAVAAWRHEGRGRMAWALMGASAFSWGAGELVWSWYELHLGVAVPFPSLADAGYLGAVPLAIAAALVFPGVRRDGRARLAGTLDGLIIACGLLAISWVAVLHTVEAAGADSILAQVLSIAYPAGDVLIATMLATLLVRLPRENRLPFALLIAGLAGNAVADSGFAYLTAAGTYGTGNALDTGWFAGYMLLGLGAVRAAWRPATSQSDARAATWWQLVLPYIPLAATIAVAAREVVSDTLEPFVFWLLAALIVLVVSRQFLTLFHNHELLRNLGSREEEMRHRAYHDPLTDLPNRELFRRCVVNALEPAEVGPDPCLAVLVIDLDDFKDVNDGLGHDVGDRLLVEVAARLRSSVRSSDTAARIGGDEFAVLLNPVQSLWHAKRLAERVVDILRVGVEIDSHDVGVQASVGLAAARAGDVSYDELLRRADVAMYRAKGEGKGRYIAYERGLEAAMPQPERRAG